MLVNLLQEGEGVVEEERCWDCNQGMNECPLTIGLLSAMGGGRRRKIMPGWQSEHE